MYITIHYDKTVKQYVSLFLKFKYELLIIILFSICTLLCILIIYIYISGTHVRFSLFLKIVNV